MAYHQAAHAAGGTLSGTDLRSLNGAAVPDAAQRLTSASGLTITPSLLGRCLEAAVATSQVAAMPGAAQLLRCLTTHVAVGVASNAPAGVVVATLQRVGLADLLPVVLSADHVRRPKPAPDVYLRICQLLDVDPSDAIAMEDSALGAAAAAAAGITVIVIPSEPAARAHADLVVPRLDDPRILELFGLGNSAAGIRS